MDISKKTDRTALKSYFVKNAIPTASNFADLIEGALNQKEDGIAKLPGEPLSIQAEGDATSQKKAINFYSHFTEVKPAWTLSLNPRSDPANAATARPGMSVADSDGNSRLFIDQFSGQVGLGTVNPLAKLDVKGSLKVEVNHNATKDPDSKLSHGGSLVLKGNAPQIDFVDTDNNDWAIHANMNKLYFVREPWNFQDLVLDGTGNVGIGTDAPRARFEVRGGAIMPTVGNTEASGIQFPSDPGGGSGDRAWLRYYARAGEDCTLELGVANDSNDHILLNPSGAVGIKNTSPAEVLDVNGRVKAGNLTIGPWPADSSYGFLGTNTLNQADGGNYALLQGAAASSGVTFLNSPQRIHFRIGNHDHMVLHNDGVFSMLHSTNPLYFTEKWNGFPDAKPNVAEISNDTSKYRTLMLVGNKSGGGERRVDVWDRFTVHGTFVNSSDRRHKQDIEALNHGLEEVLRLRPVSFNWKESFNAHRSVGLIAQEVLPVLPEIVYADNDSAEASLNVSYTALVPVLINAIQELTQRVATLESELVLSAKAAPETWHEFAGRRGGG